MCACTYACLFLCKHVCMYACMYKHTHTRDTLHAGMRHATRAGRYAWMRAVCGGGGERGSCKNRARRALPTRCTHIGLNGPGQSRGARGRGELASETGSKRVCGSERAHTHTRKCTVWKKRFKDRVDSSQSHITISLRYLPCALMHVCMDGWLNKCA